MRFLKSLVLLILFIGTEIKAQTVNYIGFPIASKHINMSGDFQEVNIGFSKGIIWNLEENINYSIEAGMYYNSYREITTYAYAAIDYRIINDNYNNQLRAGIFSGLFRYPNLTNRSVNIGEYILIGGMYMKYRMRNVELYVGYVPIYLVTNTEEALLTFKINVINY